MRRDLKTNWGFNNFRLYNNSSLLVKDDRKMSHADLYNGITLFAEAQNGPYTWDLFVELKGSHGSKYKVTIDEVR